MSVSFPVLAPRGPSAGAFFCLDKLKLALVAVGSTDFLASAYAPFLVRRRTVSPITPGLRRVRHFVGISRVLILQQAPAIWFFDDIGLLGHVERILISAGQKASIMGHQRLCRSRAVGARPAGEKTGMRSWRAFGVAGQAGPHSVSLANRS